MNRKEEIKKASMIIADGKVSSENFVKGAQWADETLIEKAVKWLKSYRQETFDGTGYVAGIINDKTIEDFKRAMEE